MGSIAVVKENIKNFNYKGKKLTGMKGYYINVLITNDKTIGKDGIIMDKTGVVYWGEDGSDNGKKLPEGSYEQPANEGLFKIYKNPYFNPNYKEDHKPSPYLLAIKQLSKNSDYIESGERIHFSHWSEGCIILSGYGQGEDIYNYLKDKVNNGEEVYFAHGVVDLRDKEEKEEFQINGKG